jgi:hypothetical protein
MDTKEFPSLDLCGKIGHLFSKTNWYWYKTPENDGKTTYQIYHEDEYSIRDGIKVGGFVCPTPTVVEMLERLPKQIKQWDLKIDCNAGDGYCVYYDMMEPDPDITDEYLPNALAKMLNHLDQKGLIARKGHQE